ncbi:MAG: hypothetical protein COV78_00900 [Candidatus Pacebacteria bacterium CG11_big_fil_rev_8_21_14_0_20_34_55]|nr:MAG: hypothetical protein COV78_00900 [Candidatus Pacebacteria bacterium CG11_big_fil_rev_8_21_14_0_20_34_55]
MQKSKLFLKNNILVLVALFFIVFIGAFLRFWHIDTAPKGALIDELHFGYLAKSLILTGKDEHGESWPVIFEGFGDRKLPAMAYLDIPSVAAFGLTLVAIRVPSAVAGTLLILASFWLLWEITRRKKWALFAALITAISPWSFFLSRFGFESNIALLGLTTGLASLFTAQRTKQNYWYIISALSFAVTWYSYIAYRPIAAVILFVFAVLKLVENFKANKKPIFLLFISFVIVVSPLLTPRSISVNNTRVGQVGIGSDSGTTMIINEKRYFCATQLPRLFCDITWNKPTYVFRELTHRYLMAFSPEFLVTKGELSTDFLTIDSFGQFFPILYPLIFFGLAGFLFVKKTPINKTQMWLIIVGLLISPIPSAIVGEPQKVRISALFPFLLITITYGAIVVDKLLKTKLLRSLFLAGLVIVLFGYSFLYNMEYFGVHTTQYEYKYQSYLPTLHRYLDTLPKEAVINIVPFYSDPLMFHAFYTNMDPALYQSLAVLDEYDGANFRHTVELGNIWSHKYSPEYMSCWGIENNKQVFFVTNVEQKQLKYSHVEKSANEVNTYAYVYDVTKYMIKEDCETATNL